MEYETLNLYLKHIQEHSLFKYFFLRVVSKLYQFRGSLTYLSKETKIIKIGSFVWRCDTTDKQVHTRTYRSNLIIPLFLIRGSRSCKLNFTVLKS